MNPSRYRNHRSPWTLHELAFVEKHYGSMATAAIAQRLGRTPASVRAAAHSMGCSSGNKTYAPWSEEEKEIVRTHYAKGSAQVMALLPGRTPEAVKLKACDTGIRYLGSESVGQKIWSEAE
ncbi:hypothetical protein [Pseudenterobacter timonensis]|uniref:GcrA cell cycle regulator n=1 Tax=Pseudenterobacter timonensis TaxID=1755099 RepID=A0ABV4A4L0_9ENTR